VESRRAWGAGHCLFTPYIEEEDGPGDNAESFQKHVVQPYIEIFGRGLTQSYLLQLFRGANKKGQV
jgi:hypothetical protein